MGTLTNGRQSVPWSNPLAPDAQWVKAYDTDLDPIVKDSVIVTALPDAEGHPFARIIDGTRMVGVSDDKDEDAPVLAFSRVEFQIFAEGIASGRFAEFYATDDEMAAAMESADVACA